MSNKIKLSGLFIISLLFVLYTIFSERLDSNNKEVALPPPKKFVKEKNNL